MDKGGKTYAPSNKLRSLTLPDLEPMAFGCAWLWNHDQLDAEGGAPIHTFSIGAARPSDLDQAAVAAYLHGKKELLPKVREVTERLNKAKVKVLGQDWADTCYQGTVKADKSKYGVEHNQIIWLYNCINAWGLLAFARDRYATFDGHTSKCDDSLSLEENIDQKIMRGTWGFMPGLAPEKEKDYFLDDLSGVPEKNRAHFREVYAFVHKWCSKEGQAENTESPPKEWETAYEMKTFKDFPERESTVFPAEAKK
jgi:hypothetical protein